MLVILERYIAYFLFCGEKKMSDTVYNDSLRFLKGKMKIYNGYENQDKRNGSDDSIRKFITEKLIIYLDKAREAQEAAIFTQMTVIWPDVELLVSNLENVLRLVKTTNYGTSTFFSSSKFEGFDPSVLVLAESEIVKSLDDLQTKFVGFYESIESGLLDVSTETMGEILKNVNRIKELYSERRTLIQEYKKF